MPTPRRFATFPLLTLAVAALLPGCRPEHLERKWTAMGAEAAVEVWAEKSAVAEEAAAEVRRALEHAEASLSQSNPESEISRLNRVADREDYTIWDGDLKLCLTGALDLARRTGGRFDPTVGPLLHLWGGRHGTPRVPPPAEVRAVLDRVGFAKVRLDGKRGTIRFLRPEMELDLGGAANGCALDVVGRSGAFRAGPAALVTLGRSRYARSYPPGEKTWAVPIEDPGDRSARLGTIAVVDRFVSTSGGRGEGFMDPATGAHSASNVVQATVIADSGVVSQALGAALVVAGAENVAEILAKIPRAEAVLVVRRLQGVELLASRSLEGRLSIDPAYAARIGGAARFVLPPDR